MAASRGLKGALILTTLFLVAEVAGGLISNSLTLLADAGHMFTDVGALAFSLFVVWLARQPATSQKTYGYLRWEILAALLNGARAPRGVGGNRLGGDRAAPRAGAGRNRADVRHRRGRARRERALRAAAAFGVGHSLNVRAAYLHVLSDLLGSAAAVVAALFIRYKGWAVADPIASIVMTLLIVRSSWSLVRESVDVLLEATPVAHRSQEGARLAPGESTAWSRCTTFTCGR